MAATLYKVNQQTSILEDKYNEALEAAKEFFIAKDIKGIKLCWSGRVVRAMAIAPTIATDKQEGYRALVNGLVEKAEEANKRQRDTWLAYAETAKFSAEKPKTIDLPQCQCEGCRMVEENNQYINSLQKNRQ